MDIILTQKQEQILSPQMIQTLRVLQMGSQELLDYIESSAQENPVLELSEQPRTEEDRQLRQEAEWLHREEQQTRFRQTHTPDAADEFPRDCGVAEEQQETLQEVLLEQLEPLRLSPKLRRAVILLIESLDSTGRLDESLSDIAAATGISEPLLQQALDILQQLEPAGIAGRDLGESLCLQLRRVHHPLQHIALEIARNHLEDVAKFHYGLIAKRLRCSVSQVKEACNLIRTLNPRPAAAYAPAQKTVYLIPDVTILPGPNGPELQLNDNFYPTLHISSYYTRMLQEDPNNKEVQTYLTDKIRQAKQVMQAVEQRRSTLLRCAQYLLLAQQDFFEKGPGHLAPLTLSDVAKALELHESTVSRAMQNKHLQCAYGVFPMSYFFSRAVGGAAIQDASADSAKALLKKLIEGENHRKPLSDQQLCTIMAERGCAISRRTVAKYREEMGIPNTTGRRMDD